MESPQVGEVAPEETIADRLEKLLDRRSPWKWGERVLLNDGTIGRMLKNKLPDPAALVPAIRIENLSLNWLLDGMGKPHPVAAPIDDAEASRWIRTTLDEDDSAEILLLYSDEGFTPVLHSAVQAECKAGKYTYRATTIIGGAAHGAATIDAIRRYAHPMASNPDGSRVRSVEIPGMAWRLLAWGYLGNNKLFGDTGQGGLYADSRAEIGAANQRPYSVVARNLRDEVADGPTLWLDETQREAQAAFAGLNPTDRAAALRMLKGLLSNN